MERLLSKTARTNWRYPDVGNMKLNMDASYKEGSKFGIGDRGEWVRGFYGKIHECNVLEAEIQAIYTGLGVVRNLNGKEIEVETDSLMAVELLNGPKNLTILWLLYWRIVRPCCDRPKARSII